MAGFESAAKPDMAMITQRRQRLRGFHRWGNREGTMFHSPRKASTPGAKADSLPATQSPPAHDAAIAAEFALPVAIHQHWRKKFAEN